MRALRKTWCIELIDLEDNHLSDEDGCLLLDTIADAAEEMKTCRGRIRIKDDHKKNYFSCGNIINQPSMRPINTRWRKRTFVTEETARRMIEAGRHLTEVRVRRMKEQQLLESQRFRIQRKPKTRPKTPPPFSNAWEVLESLRPELQARCAKKLRERGVILPRRLDDAISEHELVVEAGQK